MGGYSNPGIRLRLTCLSTQLQLTSVCSGNSSLGEHRQDGSEQRSVEAEAVQDQVGHRVANEPLFASLWKTALVPDLAMKPVA